VLRIHRIEGGLGPPRYRCVFRWLDKRMAGGGQNHCAFACSGPHESRRGLCGKVAFITELAALELRKNHGLILKTRCPMEKGLKGLFQLALVLPRFTMISGLFLAFPRWITLLLALYEYSQLRRRAGAHQQRCGF